MVAMYCLYHGRQGLRNIATKIHVLTCDLAESEYSNFANELIHSDGFLSGVKAGGHSIKNELFFDTLKIKPRMSIDEIKQRAQKKRINLRYHDNGSVRITNSE